MEQFERSFIIRVGLGDITGSADDIRTEIGHRLDDHEPDLHKNHDGRLVLTLTIAATDLWISLLLAMVAVTSTGYPPEWVEARPTCGPRGPVNRLQKQPDAIRLLGFATRRPTSSTSDHGMVGERA